MKRLFLSALALGGLVLLISPSCAHRQPTPPQAEKTPHDLSKFGETRHDPYFWLKERENPKVLRYLTAENLYTDEVMKPVKSLEEKIFAEMKSRTKEDESTYPYPQAGYFYYSRFEKGRQYPIYTRKKGSLSAAEEILLNVNDLAAGHDFCETTQMMMSPDQNIAAYGVDFQGRRFYSLHFKDLRTGKTLDNKIEKVTGNLVWAADNDHVFYSQQNPETLRSEKIFRYSLKTGKSELVYFEKDETFSVEVYKSLARKHIYIGSSSTLTSEVRYLPADRPLDKFKIFLPRQRKHEYAVSEGEDGFYILTNKHAQNFRLMKTDFAHTDFAHWKEVVPHRRDVYLSNVLVFQNHVVLEERQRGLSQIHVLAKEKSQDYLIPLADASYLVGAGANAEYKTDTLRYNYESMRLPESIYDFDMVHRKAVLLKIKEIPNYNPDLYVAERIFIPARDGAEVPVSLIHRRDVLSDGRAPMLVYGYGSYGSNMDPWYSPAVFSLVDRGFVYAIAHIRGGSEMGRDWYEKGRVEHKKNTFTDFIDVTEGLLQRKYADPQRVYAMGGSAGGLLMGSIMNMRPDLYRGVVAQVPFVDVLTTMLDDSIPLTTAEYDEWGNPNEKAAYDYIRTYSPYDNVGRHAYPSVLVTTGLHDSQVQYWEPAKWVAKLRDNKTNDALVLLKTDMTSGHGGASGRFDQLKEEAEEYAFLLLVDQRKK